MTHKRDARLVAARIAKRSVGTMVLWIVGIQFFAMVFLSVFLSWRNIDSFLAGSARYLEELISIGDFIEVSRHLSAAQAGGQIFRGDLIDLSTNRVVASTPSLMDRIASDAANSYFGGIWPPRIFRQVPLSSSRGLTNAALRIEMPIPLAPLAIGSAAIIGYAIILFLSFRRFLKDVLSQLVSPLTRLADRLTRSDVSKLTFNSLDSEFEYSELNRLVAEFKHLWARLEEFEHQSHENAIARAIASTTQMLAHDVRKPFSSMKAGLKMLQDVDDVEAMKQVLGRVTEQVDRALFTVNGMLDDVMEFGGRSEPKTEPTAPDSLVEASISEIFRIRQGIDVHIEYEFAHQHMLAVEGAKVLRVFLNIIDNGVQAMKGSGRLWIKTREVRQDGRMFVRFVLGNSGPAIPTEDLGKLFEAFFTKGKKGGTGLGLAIAQKIVTAHGGRIWCESAEGRGTEFLFTLPVVDGMKCSSTVCLPKHSSEVRPFDEIAATRGKADGMGPRAGESELEEAIGKAIDALGRKPKILLVDDESLYLQALKSDLRRGERLNNAFSVVTAQNSQGTMALVGKETFDVVVCDVDMGAMSKNGYELVKDLRDAGVRAKICVHSNRSSPSDFKRAIESGADAFFPKPMSRAHLLKLIHTAIGQIEPKNHISAESSKPVVVVIEDDIFMREAWVSTLKNDCIVHMFDGARSFWAAVDKSPTLLTTTSIIVTDYYFDGEDQTGSDVAAQLKMRSSCPLVLCSNGQFPDDEMALFTARIEKEPVTWAVLKRLSTNGNE